MSNTPYTRPVALTIAGSDSGGGAGIQADLRTFNALSVYGTSAITAVTAQNLAGVSDVVGLSAAQVSAQIEAVLTGFRPRAVKTGMLWSAQTVHAIGALARAGRLPALVVDPVMVATSGANLLASDAIAAYQQALLPHAALITPNLDEAQLLLGQPIDRASMDAAARALAARYGAPVLLKGGHLTGDPVDVLVYGAEIQHFQNPRRTGVNTHGSGCTLSAAIAAELAKGATLTDACRIAVDFLARSLMHAFSLEGDHRVIGMPASDTDALLAQAGLNALATLDPALPERARQVAHGYGERLKRPDSAQAEPAHVYHAKAQP